jgi:uncharacterized membrane protein YbhN (UPF0104 family)
MKTRPVIRLTALLLLIAVAAWYARHHFQDLSRLREFDWSYFLPLLAVHLAALGLNGWMNRLLLARLGVTLTFTQWYGLAAVNALANYLPLPQGGAVARGAILKRLHGLGYRRYAATVLFGYVMSLVLVGIAGLIALAYLRYHGVHSSWLMWSIFAALTLLCVLLAPGAAGLLPGKRLEQLTEGYRLLGTPGTIARLVAARVALMAVNATGIWLAYRSIGRGTGWVSSAVIALSAMASGVINVTPGNTGAAEAAAWGAAKGIGQDRVATLNAALIYRLTAASVIFAVGPLATYVLTRRLSPQTEAAPELAPEPPLA